MARKVFFSFHFDGDWWRTQTVRQMDALEGNGLITPNRWEEVKASGDAAVERWIDSEMYGKSCVVVLVGSYTYQRKWVLKEIEKGWNKGKGVLGIRIHRMLDNHQNYSSAGLNSFEYVSLGNANKLSSRAVLRNPAGGDSKAVYAAIKNNIEGWIEEAITARQRS